MVFGQGRVTRVGLGLQPSPDLNDWLRCWEVHRRSYLYTPSTVGVVHASSLRLPPPPCAEHAKVARINHTDSILMMELPELSRK